ncbi:MAG: hypothetical protein GFH27_549309n43 [Chloroflexi bacterium AL-W]|nr:hypothetical protein [Chloroflexi bacterium AL-N1]NOK69746.1 hypothetical protein [Chloroflexi bacterium AL-N10]NOK73650.1 hypothetical protein [Chloroflexi bacterium AL-N5]NOK83916.1 hypothetical protein [Chloroflexi bacterium AL-W]NOK87981.1 hypothetical protein [Chloroflexi bacterium AL-N15]
MFTHSIRTYRLFIITIVIVSPLVACDVLDIDIEEPLASDTTPTESMAPDTVAEPPVSATDMPTPDVAPTPDASTHELESVTTTPESEASVPAENIGNVARIEQATLVANPGETESSTTFRTRLDEVTLVGTVAD